MTDEATPRPPLSIFGDFATEEEELDARRMFMSDKGYRMCGIAACNCNSWHDPQYIQEAFSERAFYKEALAEIIALAKLIKPRDEYGKQCLAHARQALNQIKEAEE